MRRGGGITYLLRDEFTTDEAAPLTSPRAAEPGPGELTIVDVENKFSISSGKLNGLTQSTPSFSDMNVEVTVTRQIGRAFFATVNVVAGSSQGPVVGYEDVSLSGDPYNMPIGIYFNQSSQKFRLLVGAQIAQQLDYTYNTDYQVAFVPQTTGGLILMKGGTEYPEWTLLYMSDNSNAATIYARLSNYAATFATSAWKITDLSAPFDTDYGIATDRLSGARSAGDTFTHEADCIIEYTATTVPSANNADVHFRIQDASNYWQVRITSAGNLELNEIVAGTPTTRGSAAAVIANGDRIVIVAEGTTITVYEANTFRITYTSASNFQTETAGELDALGTGGSVSDIVTWPRKLSGSALAKLEAV